MNFRALIWYVPVWYVPAICRPPAMFGDFTGAHIHQPKQEPVCLCVTLVIRVQAPRSNVGMKGMDLVLILSFLPVASGVGSFAPPPMGRPPAQGG